MGTGYTRNDTANNIADGNVINAADLDGEFDALQSAFNAATGHSHDGTTGEGPQITSAGLAAGAVTSAAIANDSVALGTKTTGNYVAAGAVSGVGLSGSASSEGATFTVTSNATSANTASTIVARDASGNFSAGTITATLSGNATTATTASGVTANSVALGTDTTGNYVATITAGTGISGSSSTEGGTPTIALAAAGAGAGTYGSTSDDTKIDTITLDAYGRVTAVATGSTGDITGVTAGSGLTGGGTSGTVTISHLDTSSASSVNNSGTTFIQDLTIDTYGHVTAIGSATVTVTASVPSGSLMLFQQTSAPTGWTKQTTHNNKALRVVTGTASSGGSSAFTTAFGTPSVSGTVGISGAPSSGNLAVSVSGSISNTTLSTTQIPSHSHTYTLSNDFESPNGGNNVSVQTGLLSTDDQSGAVGNTSNTGGGSAHNHGHNLSGNMTGAPGVGNLAGSLSSATASINVQYVDLIIASKN